jgi:hypothetical protein
MYIKSNSYYNIVKHFGPFLGFAKKKFSTQTCIFSLCCIRYYSVYNKNYYRSKNKSYQAFIAFRHDFPEDIYPTLIEAKFSNHQSFEENVYANFVRNLG